MASIQVDHAVLQFAIARLVEVFHGCGALQFRSFEVSLDIIENYGEA